MGRYGREISRGIACPEGAIGLAEVARRVRPTMLIGASTVAHAFIEPIVREMAAHAERPIIFPLTNPTELSEAAPADLISWTDGRGLIATGSPFAPVTHQGITHTIAQANNALIFPGLGLGAIVTRARPITDEMLAAAAEALAGLVDARQPGTSLLPQVENLRTVSAAVAAAVARAAITQDLARVQLADVERAVRDAMWQPVYRRWWPALPPPQQSQPPDSGGSSAIRVARATATIGSQRSVKLQDLWSCPAFPGRGCLRVWNPTSRGARHKPRNDWRPCGR